MNQKFAIALGLSAALHLILGIALLLGNFSHDPKPTPTLRRYMEPR